MPSIPRRRWAELTWEEVAALDPDTVAVLPLAAIEQHGPHLPLEVDAVINRGLLERALELLPPEVPAVVLPPQDIGRSEEHLAFPGTLSLEPQTLIRAWTGIGEAVADCGLKRLLLFNSHGGQPQVMDIVARDLRRRRGMLVAMANWWRLGLPEGLLDAEELAHGIHGGALETSLMLYLRPDLVRLDKIADFPPASRDLSSRLLGFHGPVPFAWMTQDLNPSGAAGNARRATAEIGQRVADHAAAQLVKLLQEMAEFPLSRLAERP